MISRKMTSEHKNLLRIYNCSMDNIISQFYMYSRYDNNSVERSAVRNALPELESCKIERFNQEKEWHMRYEQNVSWYSMTLRTNPSQRLVHGHLLRRVMRRQLSQSEEYNSSMGSGFECWINGWGWSLWLFWDYFICWLGSRYFLFVLLSKSEIVVYAAMIHVYDGYEKMGCWVW